jgi:hypothetical protein
MSILTLEAWPPKEGVIKIHKGSTFDPVMTWRDVNGPIDWTGYTGALSMQFSNDVSFILSTTNGGMTLGADGSVSFILLDTSTVPVEIGYFAISILELSGKRRILARGHVEVD